jgi:hypothetical protein
MRTFSCLLVCAVLVLATSFARADYPNLLTNGGFETGNFSGWNVGGNPGYSLVAGFTFGDYHPNSGTYYAMLGSYGAESYLSQTVATTPNSSYRLSFSLSSDGALQNDFTAIENGVIIFDDVNIPDTNGYQVFNGYFIASSYLTTIQLGSRDDPSYLLLDDVSLIDPPSISSTPLPGSLWLGLGLMAAMGVTALLRRRTASI